MCAFCQAREASAAAAPIFVLNSLDADVSVIDPASLRELRRIPVGKEPHHLYLAPDERSLLVANALGDSITFIDPRTAEVQRQLTGISDPYQLRFSPDLRWFVTLANRLDHVDVYRWSPVDADRPLHLVRRIATGRTPSHQWIDSASSTVYASMQESNEIVAIDLATQSVRWRASTGRLPADVYLTADDRTLFVALTGDRFVEVYDVAAGPARLIQRIETGEGAHAFRARGDKRHVFVSNRAADTISLIDTQTRSVVDRLPGPGGPDCMELKADGRTLLVSSRWSRRLSVVDVAARKVVGEVRVGKSPHGVYTLDHAPRQ
ncbi:MAG TPA: YncE family protein [Burkholderiales bacterium]|nr:YncE family protein [Burkholderiales bacterium]